MTTLTEAMAIQPVVLDGGLATQLEAQGHDLNMDPSTGAGHRLWSARLLLDQPGAIREAHRAYFAAGARVAISASYQASFEGFAELGLDAADAADLMRRSVVTAREAAASFDDGVERWVAASVGPYGATLGDGSEYGGDYDLDVAGLRRWHRPRLEVLADAGADLLAVETIPCLAEVEALLAEVTGLGVPCWLSLTAAEGRTRAGESVADAYRMAADVAEVVAVGVNCTEAGEVAELVRIARSASRQPVVVYPNSGEGWDAQRHAWTGQASYTPDQIDGWVDAGARLVGGCCRVGPDQIAAVDRRLSRLDRAR